MLLYRAGREDEEWDVDVAQTCECCHRDLLYETDKNEGDPYWVLRDADDEHHVVCKDCLGKRYGLQSYGVTCDVCGRYIHPQEEEDGVTYLPEAYFVCVDADGEHHMLCEDCLHEGWYGQQG